MDEIVVVTKENKLNDAEKVNIFNSTFSLLARFLFHPRGNVMTSEYASKRAWKHISLAFVVCSKPRS